LVGSGRMSPRLLKPSVCVAALFVKKTPMTAEANIKIAIVFNFAINIPPYACNLRTLFYGDVMEVL
jgi:hypothetical protein